ncbi:MAG: NeuD/PglB/VioB family sugar acetyltransferase [Solirubrobacteraceae bacterium]
MPGLGGDGRPRAAPHAAAQSRRSRRERHRVLKPLLLVGAGGLCRETIELVRAINRVAPTWELVGLLDDDPASHGRVLLGSEIVGPSEAVRDRPDACVAATVASPGDPLRRLRLVSRLGLTAERYATLVHPAAVVAESAVIGPGSILHAGTVLTADVALGAHVAVMPAVVLTHDDVVQDGVTFGAGVCVAGAVTIERGAYIGSGALLREGLVVGAGAVVGMGAVVTRSVPGGEVWAGTPARRLR